MLQTGKSSVYHLGFKIFEELQHFVEEIKLLHYSLFPESTVISETRNILLVSKLSSCNTFCSCECTHTFIPYSTNKIFFRK